MATKMSEPYIGLLTKIVKAFTKIVKFILGYADSMPFKIANNDSVKPYETEGVLGNRKEVIINVAPFDI